MLGTLRWVWVQPLPTFKPFIPFSNYLKVGIHNGIDGLVAGEVRDIAWADVDGWIGQVTLLIHKYKYKTQLYIKIRIYLG